LRPATPVDAILPALDEVDVVLIMSVVPGFPGRSSCRSAPQGARCEEAAAGDQRLEIDGGIHVGTIEQARDAGVDWFVVASAIFDRPIGPALLRS
jgi:ribulose-phosphate 3-epimerase